MKSPYSTKELIKRLYWDLQDKEERQYYLYQLINWIPGLYGSMLRANFMAKRVKSAGSKLNILTGVIFRSPQNMSIGNNVLIGQDVFMHALGGITIGNNVSISQRVVITTVNHNYRDKNIISNEQGLDLSAIEIGDDVFIGANSVILPKVTLPTGIIVSAGSVVGAKPYKPYSIIAGNPARVIGHRE